MTAIDPSTARDAPSPSIEVVSGGDGLVFHHGASSAVLSWRWLRDHGEDPASFDPITKQRRVYALNTPGPRPALSAGLTRIDDQDVVRLVWPDAPTTSWISFRTLEELVSPSRSSNTQLWSDPRNAQSRTRDVAHVLVSDAELSEWVQDIERFGFGTLRGFEGSHDQAAALANRIGPVMSTIFGTTWDLASDVGGHADTAYSQTFLAPHTDGTYFHDAPGLQMFCCTERTGTGGESVVVDAWAIAETLRSQAPEHFATLFETPIPAHYVEPGVELRAERPAIRLSPSGSVVQVSMNNYDRSPMLLPGPEMDAFYAAYGALHDLANDESRWKSISLGTGDVLVNDNWRVLHGRRAYTGSRRFVGCYLNHADFESRLRVLAES